MTTLRLRAPSVDGGTLSEPAPEAVDRLVDANRQRLDTWAYDFQGRDAARLRRMIRAEIPGLALRHLRRFGLNAPEIRPAEAIDGPWIVTGHQPELFHPGVWIKNFAAAGLARRLGGHALNLIVDNDIPKASSIRVPVLGQGVLTSRRVDFDPWVEESPFEDWRVQDEVMFESFGERVLNAMGSMVSEPLLREDWNRAVQARAVTDRIGLRLAALRRGREEAWGVQNLELPLANLCETEAFLWFCSHLLAHVHRFRDVHNQALLHYRRLHGIRSRNHPVPELASRGDWHEVPFWFWRRERPRRRALMVRQRDEKTLELRADGEPEPFLELPLGPDREACCAVERLRELPVHGIRIRTRALTTTMFARLLLGDLFLHGIGGAKYDELGDQVIQDFFGLQPPPFWTISCTLHLGLPESPTTPARLREVESQLRSLEFNPDQWLGPKTDTETRTLIQAKAALIQGPTESRRQRKDRYYEIRRINQQLRPLVQSRLDELQHERHQLLEGLAWNTRARSREYAFVLHNRDRIRNRLLPWAETVPKSGA